jgi:hypothetical protein
MKLFHWITSHEEAEAAKSLVYEIVSKKACVSGISIVHPLLSYAIRVNLENGLTRGLPRRVNGVRVIYEHVSNIRIF